MKTLLLTYFAQVILMLSCCADYDCPAGVQYDDFFESPFPLSRIEMYSDDEEVEWERTRFYEREARTVDDCGEGGPYCGDMDFKTTYKAIVLDEWTDLLINSYGDRLHIRFDHPEFIKNFYVSFDPYNLASYQNGVSNTLHGSYVLDGVEYHNVYELASSASSGVQTVYLSRELGLISFTVTVDSLTHRYYTRF